MWKWKFSNFYWCGVWSNWVVGSWTTWFLDFNKRGAWNKRGGAKFGPFLINVVAELTELWVENSQKINCRDVTSIQEGRALCPLYYAIWNHVITKSLYIRRTKLKRSEKFTPKSKIVTVKCRVTFIKYILTVSRRLSIFR